jgi:hypothetical protein
MLTRTEISSEIGTIELQLIDAALSDEVRFSLYGAQQALRWVLDAETCETANQTFYRLGARPHYIDRDEITSVGVAIPSQH